MQKIERWFWVGERDAVRHALVAGLGSAPAAGAAADAAAGDLVVVDVRAGAAAQGLPHGHVFSGVRALKERRGVAVAVVVDEDDRIGEQLTRFCLADAVLRWRAASGSLDLGELLQGRGDRSRPSVDDLLARLEKEVAASGRGETTLQRLLRFEREDSLLLQMQDRETGLFDGAYATLKLDEEWKRSRRFHQPLSLLLLDLGPGVPQWPEAQRREVLAAAAGVFLNECRDIDVLARFAPTTFLFLLPGTGLEGGAVLGRRMLQALRQRLPQAPGLSPAAGLAAVPSSQIGDRKAFLLTAEACLRRAQAGAGDGGLCTTWQ